MAYAPHGSRLLTRRGGDVRFIQLRAFRWPYAHALVVHCNMQRSSVGMQMRIQDVLFIGVYIRIIDSRHAAYCGKWVVDTGVCVLSSSQLAYAHALDVHYNMQYSSVGMQTRIYDVL